MGLLESLTKTFGDCASKDCMLQKATTVKNNFFIAGV